MICESGYYTSRFCVIFIDTKNASAKTIRLLRFKFSQIRDGDKAQCAPQPGNEYPMHWHALRTGKYSCWHFWLPEGRYPHSLEASLHPCHEQDKDRPLRWQSHSRRCPV